MKKYGRKILNSVWVFIMINSCTSVNDNQITPFDKKGYHQLPLLAEYRLMNGRADREGWLLMEPDYMLTEQGFDNWKSNGSTVTKFVSIQEKDSTIYLWNWDEDSDTDPLSDSLYLIIDIAAREERFYFERDNFIKDIELYHNASYPQWHSVLESWQYLRSKGTLPWKVLSKQAKKDDFSDR